VKAIFKPFIRAVDLRLSDPKEVVCSSYMYVAVSAGLRVVRGFNAGTLQLADDVDRKFILRLLMKHVPVFDQIVIGCFENLFERVESCDMVGGKMVGHQAIISERSI